MTRQDGDSRRALARRMFELVEPVGAIPYAVEAANEELLALGFTDPWDAYFAGRAAALGQVPAEVVDAAFFGFAPGEVARHLPKVWRTTTPEAAIAAREAGCVRVLRSILGDLVDAPGFARATELLLRAATSAPVAGRPLYAGLRSLPIPAEVVARCFHAASLLREHRGDGHVAVLVAEGVGGTEAHVLHALDQGMPAAQLGRLHHLPPAQLEAVVDGMRARGLVGEDGWPTEAGHERKARVESRTDDLAAAPYAALESAEVEALQAALEPVAAAIAAATG